MNSSRQLFWEHEIEDLESEIVKLQQIYNLKKVSLDFDNITIELLKVSNIDDLLDRANDPDEIPFWAELWPSSIGMAQFILEKRAEFKGKKLLELGAGVGLAGIVAKIAGADVIQSDFSVEALKFTQVNCKQNQVSDADLLLADWRSFPLESGGFDFIIGADILYEKTFHQYLSEIFCGLINPAGTIILSDPGRNYAKDFMSTMEKDWLNKSFSIPVFYDQRSYKIDLYQLTLKGN